MSVGIKQTKEYTGHIPNKPISFSWFTAKPYIWFGIFGILGVVIAQTAGSLQAYLVGTFVDSLLSADSLVDQLDTVYRWGFIFIGLFLTIYIGWRMSGYVGAIFITRQNAHAAQLLYRHTVQHSHTYFSDNFSGSISNKIAHASDGSSEMLMSMMFDVFRHGTSIVMSGALLALVSPYLTLVFFAVVAVTIVLNYFLVQIRRPLVEKYSESTTALRGQVIDVLTNIQATRHYTNFANEDKRISNFILDRSQKDLKQWHYAQHINVVNNIIAICLTALVLTGTYFLLQSGEASPGDVVLVIIAMFSASYSMLSIGEIFNKLMRFYGETNEGLTDLLVDHEIVNAQGAKKLKVTNGEIHWEDVFFRYNQNQVFKDFKLTITSGQRVGLVGASGAGKTTFVSLLLRQHELTAGAIKIDGQNIAEVTQDSLRQHIAVVPQEPMLFHRTIKENIAYGKVGATMKEIEAVAKKAQAHGFITDLPEGYDTMVGERGVKLSGGQKQRVAIARAMLKDAPILVLDEATSALDSESEVEIQKALHRLMSGKTVIAIAHRLSTLREMDRIIVLDAGKIVEDGSHEALVAYGGVYANLWKHQAGGFLVE